MRIPIYRSLLLAVTFMGTVHAQTDKLNDAFRSPPPSARPGVYWYFMDGNLDKQEMVNDLESMNAAGLGSALFLEVGLGVPRGGVEFMGETWQDYVSHAFKAAERLGMEVLIGTGPGWSGSGGAWVPPEDSMQQLVGSSTRIQGPARFAKQLPVPPPHPANPYAKLDEKHTKIRDEWFQDVAVLAFPTPGDSISRIENWETKTLKNSLPTTMLPEARKGIPSLAEYPEPADLQAIDLDRVVDLTAAMDADGTLRWEVPEGDWTVMRFVARSTGQLSRPAPQSGVGFEHDKMNGESFRRHWANYQAKLLKKVGPKQPGKGVTTIHLDSWEMSSQNWTEGFREDFRKRRLYDPLPFYPAFIGLVVENHEKTERFLWDLRKTAQELVLEEYAGTLMAVAHENGLLYSNEPYAMNPSGNIDLGSVADIVSGEFWNARRGLDSQYSCIEAVSIAHVMGREQVSAEAFTTFAQAFLDNPCTLKNQGDWALAMGINKFMFHTFQHQAGGDREKPGMAMGPYGVHWHRNLTWWHMVRPFHEYLTRCSSLMRQGKAVADILYLTREGAPTVFDSPASAQTGSPRMRDKRGYNFDAVSPRVLDMRATVEDGKIAFPGGTRYRVMVLPDSDTMTPGLLEKVTELVKAGATVIGNPPLKSPSLVGYPECDAKVGQLAEELWGKQPQPERQVGKGRILTTEVAPGERYPHYDNTAAVLARMGVPEDFAADGPIRYGHRRTASAEIYFVSNTSTSKVETTCRFRVSDGVPELWDPVTGEIRPLPEFVCQGGLTNVPMAFEPHQSFFVVFSDKRAESVATPKQKNFADFKPIMQIDGPWQLAFEPKWGGPAKVEFDQLIDWSTHEDEGIRYYSGSATYRKEFGVPETTTGQSRTFLDLGTVHSICRVKLNGKDLGILWSPPWRVEVSDALEAGSNVLEIEVVNDWVNRLIGDQQPANAGVRNVTFANGLLGGQEFKAGRYTFTHQKFYEANAPLLPAGLLGPVRLISLSPEAIDR